MNTAAPTTRVLVIEDDTAQATLISRMLEQANRRTLSSEAGLHFEVEHVRTLAEAAARMARPGIDAALLDLNLPDSEGLETVRALHQPGIPPIIVLTGMDDLALGVQSVESGAQDFVVKGKTSGLRLVDAIQYAIARSKQPSASGAVEKTGLCGNMPVA